MLEENTVAAPDRHLSPTSWIIGKTNPGREIKQMALHAAGRNTVNSALNHAGHMVDVEPWREYQRSGIRIDCRRSGAIIGIGVEIVRSVVALAVGAEKARSQAQIEGEVTSGAPIVLEIGLHNSIPVVVLDLTTGLRKARNSPSQQVGKWITSGV